MFTESQAEFVFESESERYQVAMDYLRTTWNNINDPDFDASQENHFANMVMFVKDEFEKILTTRLAIIGFYFYILVLYVFVILGV